MRVRAKKLNNIDREIVAEEIQERKILESLFGKRNINRVDRFLESLESPKSKKINLDDLTEDEIWELELETLRLKDIEFQKCYIESTDLFYDEEELLWGNDDELVDMFQEKNLVCPLGPFKNYSNYITNYGFESNCSKYEEEFNSDNPFVYNLKKYKDIAQSTYTPTPEVFKKLTEEKVKAEKVKAQLKAEWDEANDKERSRIKWEKEAEERRIKEAESFRTDLRKQERIKEAKEKLNDYPSYDYYGRNGYRYHDGGEPIRMLPHDQNKKVLREIKPQKPQKPQKPSILKLPGSIFRFTFRTRNVNVIKIKQKSFSTMSEIERLNWEKEFLKDLF